MIQEDAVPKAVESPEPTQFLADSTPAIITDHKFSPKGEWFTLCCHCNLAESAHAETELEYYGDAEDLADDEED